jgi:hypothetical protein
VISIEDRGIARMTIATSVPKNFSGAIVIGRDLMTI